MRDPKIRILGQENASFMTSYTTIATFFDGFDVIKLVNSHLDHSRPI